MQLFPFCKQNQRKNSKTFDKYVHIAQYILDWSGQSSENGFYFPISLYKSYKTFLFLICLFQIASYF